MPTLDFAFWDAVSDADAQANVADVYERHIRLAQKLETLGWHSYFTIEHQNSPVGRITSPAVYLTAIARETSHLRLGTMIWQLPFYHPLRLAEEVAMLDQLSHGRVEFGVGFGVHEHEFIRWGMDFYQRHEIGDEILRIVKLAWTQDEVTFEGKYFHFDEAIPLPKPFQKPYPPIWAAVHSNESFEWAARNNLHAAKNLDTDEVVEQRFNPFGWVWKEGGHAGPPPRMFLMRNVHVAETDEKAPAEARQYLAQGNLRFAGSPAACPDRPEKRARTPASTWPRATCASPAARSPRPGSAGVRMPAAWGPTVRWHTTLSGARRLR